MRVHNDSVQDHSSDQDSRDSECLDYIPNIMRQKSGIADQTMGNLSPARIRPKISKKELKLHTEKNKYMGMKNKFFNSLNPRKINQNCIAEVREITKKPKETQENIQTAASTQPNTKTRVEMKLALATTRVPAIDEILGDNNFDQSEKADSVYHVVPVKYQIEKLERAMTDLHDKMSKRQTSPMMKVLKSVTFIKLFNHIIPLDDRPLSMDITNIMLLKKQEV